MIALLSNGITSEALRKAVNEFISPLASAAVVVTADNEYKEQNYHVPRVVKELQDYGLTVDTFDLDKQDATELLNYDVVEFIGGNPYYLLNSIRKHNATDIIKQLAEKKVLLGWSAGALVLTPSIEIVNRLTPEMNIVDLNGLNGLSLVDTHILPHYNKFMNHFENLEDICQQYEKENNCSVIRLNDGDGIVIKNGIKTLVIGS